MISLPGCQVCGAPLARTFLDLGDQPLANALVRQDRAGEADALYPLHVRVCEPCLLVQVDRIVAPQAIFAGYPYFSSYSETWLAHCAQLAGSLTERLGLGEDSRVVEIGSNDGALLACLAARNIPALGVEPAENVAQAALDRGLATDIAFFGKDTAERLVAAGWKADLVVATNVIAHVPDIRDFVAGVRLLLKQGGMFVAEFPHFLNLVRQVQFDTIYHEHFTYLSLIAMRRIFERQGLALVDVERQSVHGGSLRVFAAPSDTAPAAGDRVEEILAEEVAAGLDRASGYGGFQQRVGPVCDALAEFLARSRDEGRLVVGYGAAAKGNILLNHVGATPAEIAFVVDRNPAKQGRLLPGTRIPVRPVEALVEAEPDYVLILPWNLRDEVVGQLPQVARWGGKFVTAIPRLEIL